MAAKASGAVVALLEIGPLHQISGDLGRRYRGDIPGHHLVAPHIDYQVEVQPHTPHRGGQIGDVPAPNLVWPVRGAGSGLPGATPDRSCSLRP